MLQNPSGFVCSSIPAFIRMFSGFYGCLLMIQQPFIKGIPIVTGCHSGGFFVGAGEVVAVGEAKRLGDIGDRLVGVGQQEVRGVDFLAQDKLLQRHAGALGEQMREIFCIVAEVRGDVCHLEVFRDMKADEIQDVRIDLPVGAKLGVIRGLPEQLSVELGDDAGRHRVERNLWIKRFHRVLQLFHQYDNFLRLGKHAGLRNNEKGVRDSGQKIVRRGGDIVFLDDTEQSAASKRRSKTGEIPAGKRRLAGAAGIRRCLW